MLRLFQAGFIAAGYQLVAVVSNGVVVSLLVRYDLLVPPGSARIPTVEQIWIFVEPLLSWADLLAAIGVALTSDAYLEPTAQRIRRASRTMCPTNPAQTTNILLVQLWMVAIILAIFVLAPPPVGLMEAGYRHGYAWAVSLGWPGITSIGVASFWTNARAAHKALN
jgi:hypothetical protein